MQDRAALRALLAGHVPEYDKHTDYEVFAGGYAEAAARAARLAAAADDAGEAGRNPTTGVYRLTEDIRAQ